MNEVVLCLKNRVKSKQLLQEYGNGENRKNNIYKAVQNQVNKLLR